MAQNKYAVGYCVYCNGPVNTEKDDNFYSKTKRKTIVFFHGSCYRTYEKLAGDWIE